jgi:NMD protein affecting ribosome stability and mRNA decay
MAECIKCGEYTKFNGGLCSKCYAQKQNENTTNKSYSKDKET